MSSLENGRGVFAFHYLVKFSTVLGCLLVVAVLPAGAATPSPAQVTLSQTGFDRDALAAEVFSALQAKSSEAQYRAEMRGRNNAAAGSVLARIPATEFKAPLSFRQLRGVHGRSYRDWSSEIAQ